MVQKIIFILFGCCLILQLEAQEVYPWDDQIFDAVHVPNLYSKLPLQEIAYQKIVDDLDSSFIVVDSLYHAYFHTKGTIPNDDINNQPVSYDMYWIRSSLTVPYRSEDKFYDDYFMENVFLRLTDFNGAESVVRLYQNVVDVNRREPRLRIGQGISSIWTGNKIYKFKFQTIGSDLVKKSVIYLANGKETTLENSSRLDPDLLEVILNKSDYSQLPEMQEENSYIHLFPLIPWDVFFPGSHSCCVQRLYGRALEKGNSFILSANSIKGEKYLIVSINFSVFEGGKVVLDFTESTLNSEFKIVSQKMREF